MLLNPFGNSKYVLALIRLQLEVFGVSEVKKCIDW